MNKLKQQIEKFMGKIIVESQTKGDFLIAKRMEYVERQILGLLADYKCIPRNKLEEFIKTKAFHIETLHPDTRLLLASDLEKLLEESK